MSDDQILFLLALGAILIVTGLATLAEYALVWLWRRWKRIEQQMEEADSAARGNDPL